MKWTMLAFSAAAVMLLLADFLAFHDLFEPHTARDWLVLVASGLAVAGLAAAVAGRFDGHRQGA